jgi:hypothetical protein
MNRTLIAFLVAALAPVYVAAQATLPGSLRLPPGFMVEVLVKVPGARSMALGDNGTLFVSTQRGAGNVYAVREPFSGNPQLLTVAEDAQRHSVLAGVRVA